MKQSIINSQRKYMAANTYRMELRLHNRNDADIIEYFESSDVPRTQLIKEALREKMARDKR